MEWLLLALVLVPVVFMCGFAGCGVALSISDADHTPVTLLSAERVGERTIKLKWAHPNALATFRVSRGESSKLGIRFSLTQDGEHRIARLFGVRCWPSTMRIGRDGMLRKATFGLLPELETEPSEKSPPRKSYDD